MKREGNILIMTLMACVILAMLLVTTMMVLANKTGENQSRIDSVKLEQLHRTATRDALKNAQTQPNLKSGDVLLDDAPLEGQYRKVVVDGEADGALEIETTVWLAEGAKRVHHSQWLPFDVESRMDFVRGDTLVLNSANRPVTTRWLGLHKKEDIVVLAGPQSTQSTLPQIILAQGASLTEPLAGSIYLGEITKKKVRVRLRSALALEGSLVCTGDIELGGNLSCKKAWIDGTLTIGEGVALRAEDVVLKNDVSEAVLEKIEAARIYMPHPPEEPPEGKNILPLSKVTEQTSSARIYLPLQEKD